MRQPIGWLFFVALTAAAQQPQPAATFRAGSKLVQVDVVVRDKKGPAAGLTKEDFMVFDNGKQQEIAVFSVRSFAVKASPALGRIPIPLGAVSNRPDSEGEASATETVLLIDQKNTQRADQEYAIERIVKFIEKRRKRDRIGIYTFGKNGVRPVQELTDDPDALKRAVSNLRPQDPTDRFYDPDGSVELAQVQIIDRVKDTKRALDATARHLSRIPGRKNLIWLSSSFPLIVPPGGAGQAAARLRLNFTPDMEEAARALNEADVALYAVDPRGLLGDLSGLTGLPGAQSHGNPRAAPAAAAGAPVGPPGIDTMNLLARLTGGKAFFNTNGIEDSIETAVEDAELTYTLGFYPTQESKDQEVHKLKVKVARSGVDVRYRENYSASSILAAGGTADARPTMEQLIEDPLDATQIELIAQHSPNGTRPGSFNVQVSIDVRDVQLEYRGISWEGILDVSFFVEGSKAAWTITSKTEIPRDHLAAGLEKPIMVETSITLAELKGVLRIVAQDRATGAAGSVRLPLGGK